MPFFTYKAINLEGDVIRGFVEESDMDLAYDNVSSSGLHVLDIKKSNKLAKVYINKLRSVGIKTKDIIEFANGISVMLRAGIPLLTSLSDIAESLENKRFKRRIEEIGKTVELGSSLSAALSQHQDIFPEIFIHLVSVGEETGGLDKSLSDVAVHLQRMEDLKSAIRRALMYPIFAIITTTGALLFWLIYVLPKMTSLFQFMSVKLPFITRFLIVASNFSTANWYVFILFPLLFFAAFKILSKSDAIKYYIDMAKLKMPIIKLIVFNRLLALFSEQLRIMLSSGITIDKSFDILIKVINNDVFRKALIVVKEDILLGSRIHEAIKKHGALFPNLVTRLIRIGEETGNLTEQLNYLSDEYLKKLHDVSQKMEKMIEPIVILFIGGIFIVIIAGLLLPIYDLISTMGGAK
ncbi:MAG: type II secretion system F family protein [Nitrospirae bacterium]|nr:type II secretion system F family protein [Nitrospirota bacterium]